MSDETTVTANNTLPILNASGVELYVTTPYATDEELSEKGLESNYQLRDLAEGDTNSIESTTTVLDYPAETLDENGYSEDDLSSKISCNVSLCDTYDYGGTEYEMKVYNLVFFQNADNWFYPVKTTTAIFTSDINDSPEEAKIDNGWTWTDKLYPNSEIYNSSEKNSSGEAETAADVDSSATLNSKYLKEKVLTIYKSDVDSMNQAMDFVKVIQAASKGTMATAYTAAISKTNTSIADIETAVSEVVADYSKFKDVTQSAIETVYDYYNSVPYVYANYDEAKYFYLYSQDSKGNSAFVGRLDFVKAETISISAKNGGYTITMYPALYPADTSRYDIVEDGGIDIIYKDGYFTDEAGSSVNLTGGFVYANTLTSTPTSADYTTIVPVLAGYALGYSSTCGGPYDKIRTNSDDSTGTGTELENDWDQMPLLSKLMTGFFVSLPVLGIFYKAIKYFYMRATNKTVDNLDADTVTKLQNDIQRLESKMDAAAATGPAKEFESKTENDGAVDWNELTVDFDVSGIFVNVSDTALLLSNTSYKNMLDTQIDTQIFSAEQIGALYPSKVMNIETSQLVEFKSELAKLELTSPETIGTLNDLSTKIYYSAQTIKNQSGYAGEALREQAQENSAKAKDISEAIDKEVSENDSVEAENDLYENTDYEYEAK